MVPSLPEQLSQTVTVGSLGLPWASEMVRALDVRLLHPLNVDAAHVAAGSMSMALEEEHFLPALPLDADAEAEAAAAAAAAVSAAAAAALGRREMVAGVMTIPLADGREGAGGGQPGMARFPCVLYIRLLYSIHSLS